MGVDVAEAADGPAWMQRIERWLHRHRLAVILALVAASVGLRAVYFLQLSRGPCLWQHRWQETDMSFFQAWAMQVATGDWLTDRALHPAHQWARTAAERHFQDVPEEALEMQRVADAARDGRSAAAHLWDRWFGGKQFHQEPLYPYLLAVTYTLLAPDVRLVFLWQMLLGVLANVLTYLLARRSFGDTVGTVAGALAVLYAPLMYYELILLREAPMTFMGLAGVWAVSRAIDRDRAAWWFAAGAVIGATILLKSTHLLFLVGVLGAPACMRFRDPARLARAAGGLTLGCALLLLPVVARNLAVGCPALSISSVGPVTFIIGNAEDFKCTGGSTSFAWQHVGEILHRTGGRLGATVVETLRTHRDAWGVLQQLWAKFLAIWHWYEIPNNANFYFYSIYAPVLRWAPLRFVAVAPLAIVGLAASWRRWRLTWPLLVMLASCLAPLVVFGTMSRYRLSLVPVLIIFAAVAAVRLVEWLAARRWRPAVAAVASTAGLALWMARPLPQDVPVIRLGDHFSVYEYHYGPRAQRCLSRNDYAGASQAIAEGLAGEPEVVRRMGPSRAALDSYESQLGLGYAQLHQLHADFLARAGHHDQAARARARADDLARAAGPDGGVQPDP